MPGLNPVGFPVLGAIVLGLIVLAPGFVLPASAGLAGMVTLVGGAGVFVNPFVAGGGVGLTEFWLGMGCVGVVIVVVAPGAVITVGAVEPLEGAGLGPFIIGGLVVTCAPVFCVFTEAGVPIVAGTLCGIGCGGVGVIVAIK